MKPNNIINNSMLAKPKNLYISGDIVSTQVNLRKKFKMANV